MPPVLATAPSVTAAIITASVSLFIAVFSAVFSQINRSRIKELEKEQAEDNAKIAYSYEARKRLYTVCEPLLFQAMEQAEDARARICSLARSASQNQLRPDGSGWLEPSEIQEYYFESTVYTLLAPVTTFSILQRRLTTIDLTLDHNVRAQYEMLKLVFFSFSRDWDLAAWGGRGTQLPYDRNKTDRGEPERETLLHEAPERFAPQGLYRGMIYLVAEALVRDGGGSNDSTTPRERCMTFGEFQQEWNRAISERSSSALKRLRRRSDPPSSMLRVFDNTVELFSGFHPRRKPVLWRVFVTQHLLYRTLLSGQPILASLRADEIDTLDWRADKNGEEDCRQPLTIAEEFVGAELASLRARLPPAASSE